VKAKGRERGRGRRQDLDWPKIETERLWICSQDNGLNVLGLWLPARPFFLVLHRTVSGLVSFPRRAKQTNRQNQTGGESGENVQDNWMKIHSCAFRFGSTKKTFAHGTQPLAFCQQPKIRIFPSSLPYFTAFLFWFFFLGGGYFVYFTCFLWCVGRVAGKSIYMSLSFPNFSLRQGSGNFAAQIELELCCPLLSYLFNLCKGCLLALPYQGTNGKKSERQSLWHPFGSTSWTRKEFA